MKGFGEMLNYLILPRKGRILLFVAAVLYILPIIYGYWDSKTDVATPQWLAIVWVALIFTDVVIIPCVIGSKYEKFGLGFIAPTAAASYSATLSIGTIGFFMLAIQAVIIYIKGLLIMLISILRFIFTYIYKGISVLRFKSHSKKKNYDKAEYILDNLFEYELISEKTYDMYSDFCLDAQ